MAGEAEVSSDGQVMENKLRSSGFSDEEVDQWKGQTTDTMTNGGFAPADINKFWGRKEPNMSDVSTHVKKNLASVSDQEQAASPDAKPKREPIDVSPKPVEAKDVWDAMAAGWSHSFAGLMTDREKPPIELSKDASISQNLVSSGAMIGGDLLPMAAGASAGGAIAGPPGAWFGMGAVPAFMRKMLMDKYDNGEIEDAGDFSRRVVSASWDAFKDGTATMAMGAVGANMKAVNALGGSRLIKAATSLPMQLAAENAAQTTVAAALSGHLPDKRDFINGTVAMAGFHALTAGFAGASSVKEKLQNIYANTGLEPGDASNAIHSDPSLKGEVFSDNPGLPKEAASAEKPAPEPVKPPSPTIKPGWELPEKERGEVLSRIGEDAEEKPETMVQKAKDGALDLYVNTFDKTARIKEILQKAGDIKLSDSSYLLARAFGDVNSKIDHFINKGTIDPTTNDVNGEPLMKILGDYAKESGDSDLGNLKAYMLSSRIKALSERGIVQDTDMEKHDVIAGAGEEKYQPYVKRVVDYENRVLNYAKGKGLISGDMQTAMEKAGGDNYIPLHKAVEADNITGGKGSPNSLKKIGDSLLQIKNPIDSIYKNTEVMVRAADVNAIKMQAAKDLLGSENSKDYITESVPDKTRVTKVGSDELSQALRKQGFNIDPDHLDGLSVFRKFNETEGPGLFSYRDDGELKTVKVPTGLADVLNSYSDHPAAMGLFTRAFRTFANSLRAGTIQNPLTGFFARHSIRNQEQAPIFSKTDLAPWDVMKSILDREKDQDLWDQATRDGAFVNSAEKIPVEYYTDQIERMDKKLPFIDQAWNKIDDVTQFSHAVIMANDNTVRFTEYKRTLEQGGSRNEATLNARDVLADFQKSGLKQNFLQATTAFFKAHYQGEFQLVGALQDPEQRLGVLARNVGYLTVPSVLLGLAQADDKRVADLPDWLKYNYWNVHIPHWRNAELSEAMSHKDAYPDEVRENADGSHSINDGYIFRIPKPFANGMAFGSVFEETLRDMQKHDPAHFGVFIGSIAEKMIANPIPTFFEPVLEQATNHNFFGGKPLVRSEMERNKVPEMQYTPYTSEFAKFLGDKIADVPLLRDVGPKGAKLASPVVLENYINAWTGGSGKYILNSLDKIMAKGGIVKDVPHPEWTWSDVPGVREFLVRQNIEPQSVTDFMDSQNLAQQVNGTIKALQKEGDFGAIAKIQQRYATDGIKIGNYQKAMIGWMSAINKVNAMPTMDPVQKRQLMDGLTYQIISAAHHGNELLDSLKKDMENKKGR